MIVAMDIGNTNIKAAVFEGSRLVKRWRCATDPVMTSDQYGIIMADLFRYHNLNMQAVEGIMISSVVPTINYTIEHMCRDYFHLEPRLLVAAGLSGFLSAYPDELSGGMKRRVALARAMHYGGDALILDEPFKGLDAPLRERVCKAVSGVFPLTVIATHDMDEARLLCPDGWPMEIIDLNRD